MRAGKVWQRPDVRLDGQPGPPTDLPGDTSHDLGMAASGLAEDTGADEPGERGCTCR